MVRHIRPEVFTRVIFLPMDHSPENWASRLYIDLHRHSEADDDLLFPKGLEPPLNAALTYRLEVDGDCLSVSKSEMLEISRTSQNTLLEQLEQVLSFYITTTPKTNGSGRAALG
ncbi:hypothetical protein WJX74_002827 [Apatococcus lobatus]|uniref:Uncharacterized protein n=1 Tax=Apatococcus lobatus TaxID=904363 RepID=A0AAW1RS78_9CHLO